MRESRSTFAGWIGLIAALLACAVPAGALAGSQPDPRPGDELLGTKGGIAYVSDTETSTDPNFTDALATCPNLGDGWRIAGGGVRSSDKEGHVVVSRPLDIYLPFGDDDDLPDDFWEAVGGLAIGKKLTSYAICMKEKKLKYSTLLVPNGATQFRSSSQSCSAGSKPTGGGGFIATSNSYLSSFFPKGKRGWQVDLLDTGGGFGGMTNNLVCLKGKLRRASKTAGVPAGETKAAKATCKGSAHVTGGGIRFSGDPGDGIAISSYPIDGKDKDKVPDDGWKVQGRNVSAGALDLSAYAICRKR